MRAWICMFTAALALAACAARADRPPPEPERPALEELRAALDGAAELDADEMLRHYETVSRHADDPDYRALQTAWAERLARRAETAGDVEGFAELAIRFDDDDVEGAQRYADEAAHLLVSEDLAVRTRRVDGRMLAEVSELFRDVSRRAGWLPYEYPSALEEWIRLEVEGAEEFRAYYMGREVSRYHAAGVYPPRIVQELQRLEALIQERGEEVARQQAEDGFAIQAREAFLRFRNANRGGRVDLERGQRVFSPVALNRESESFDDIWTYAWARPFVVYIESSQDDEQDTAALTAMLGQLWQWFHEHFVLAMGLERVLPIGPGGMGRDGTMYDTAGQRAEAEGWPLEIILLRDEKTLHKLIEAESGGAPPPPGVRAFYSVLQGRVIALATPADSELEWFSESVLIHEAFHLMSDHYAAGPIDWQQIMLQSTPRIPRPRFPNLLVQEGITDAVAGHTREGTGKEARYEFLQRHPLRLRSWHAMYASFEDRNLFRIQDLLEVMRHPDLIDVGARRFMDVGIVETGAHAQVVAQQNHGMLLALYYATACKAAWFFHHYDDGKYREQWWEYLRMAYTGEIDVSGWNPEPGVRAFAKVFELNSDEDWQRLNDEFTACLLKLATEEED
jgi:hypothetical protein